MHTLKRPLRRQPPTVYQNSVESVCIVVLAQHQRRLQRVGGCGIEIAHDDPRRRRGDAMSVSASAWATRDPESATSRWVTNTVTTVPSTSTYASSAARGCARLGLGS